MNNIGIIPQCGREFVLYTPLITFGENKHYMSYNEGYPVGTVESHSLYARQNFYRFSIEGKWYEPKELDKNNVFDYPVRAKYATPKDLCEMIDILIEQLDYDKYNLCVVVEFVLNCENLGNQVYDEESVFIPVVTKESELSDKINDIESKDVEPTAKCELPKQVDEKQYEIKIPIINRHGEMSLTKARINEYDSKNKFKKTSKEIK